MVKSSTCCLGGVMLIASLALNVAFITGCESVSVNGDFPYVHLTSSGTTPSGTTTTQPDEETLKKERAASLARLRDIAGAMGMEAGDVDNEVVLKGEIIQRLLDGKAKLPQGEISEDDIARIDEQLTGGNKAAIKEACKFVMELRKRKGKSVVVIESEAK